LLTFPADVVLVVVGVRPDTELAASAAAELGAKGAIAVDRQMRTNLPDVFAAGDCVITHHRLLGEAYLPLGTTAHKQGRIAGENALGGTREFAGSVGTQVVKVFDLAAARTGLRDHEAAAGGFDPVTVGSVADDHKAYYPGSHPITMRYTGDRRTGRTDLRPRPLLHAAARLTVGCDPDWRPALDKAGYADPAAVLIADSRTVAAVPRAVFRMNNGCQSIDNRRFYRQ
jgi:NADPH-dependent 2,4-dienoyl-CoA reductase/sulfur reductase-like enzyme